MNQDTYTVEEVSNQLKVSKLTVYDLIKKGALPAYRVGRQMRIDANDLEAYKNEGKITEPTITKTLMESNTNTSTTQRKDVSSNRHIIISGQDLSLDILANHIEKHTTAYRPLRSYVGSLDSLLSMYLGEADVVSTHLLDGDTGDYNIPYVRKILVNDSFLIINLIIRKAGFYVRKGNPKNLKTWDHLKQEDVKIANREKGSGARVLLDEQLRIHGIPRNSLNGYNHIETSHLGVASAIASGIADVGVGIEKAALLVKDIDFVPLINERYDLVVLDNVNTKAFIQLLTTILQSKAFKKELESIGGYDLSQTGTILYQQD